jgi:hypothetical protein
VKLSSLAIDQRITEAFQIWWKKNNNQIAAVASRLSKKNLFSRKYLSFYMISSLLLGEIYTENYQQRRPTDQ